MILNHWKISKVCQKLPPPRKKIPHPLVIAPLRPTAVMTSLHAKRSVSACTSMPGAINRVLSISLRRKANSQTDVRWVSSIAYRLQTIGLVSIAESTSDVRIRRVFRNGIVSMSNQLLLPSADMFVAAVHSEPTTNLTPT